MLGSPLTDKIGNEVCESQNVTGYQIGIIYHAMFTILKMLLMMTIFIMLIKIIIIIIIINRPDLYTDRHCQWFYFRLQRMQRNTE